jgi:hypothetical protein
MTSGVQLWTAGSISICYDYSAAKRFRCRERLQVPPCDLTVAPEIDGVRPDGRSTDRDCTPVSENIRKAMTTAVLKAPIVQHYFDNI